MDSDIDLKKVDKCIGDPDADVENPILKAEQESQVCLFVTYWLHPSLLFSSRSYVLDLAYILHFCFVF